METYTAEQKEYNFRKAITILLDKFSLNLSSKKFIQEFLKEYFMKLKREDLVYFIEQKVS